MDTLAKTLLKELDSLPVIDVHTHIDGRQPTATSLHDLLVIPAFNALAHASGMDPDRIKYTLTDKQRVQAILDYLPAFHNTETGALIGEMVTEVLGIDNPDFADAGTLMSAVKAVLDRSDWEERVWKTTGLERVYSVVDFADDLHDVDVNHYVPIIDIEDVVLRFDARRTRERLDSSTDIQVTNANSMRLALHKLFGRFAKQNTAAATTTLPADLVLDPISEHKVDSLIAKANHGDRYTREERNQLATFLLFETSNRCQEYKIPFQLMVGLSRDVYDHGVPYGTDLLDQRTSLYELHRLFNAFPNVTFPVSVAGHSQNHELCSYAWIYHNVVASGHWRFSNATALIVQDLKLRLQTVPRNKIIGFFSNAPRLEFIKPQFKRFKRLLAGVLAEEFVTERGWTEEQALALAREVLVDNGLYIYASHAS